MCRNYNLWRCIFHNLFDWNIYARRTSDLDSDVLRDLVPFLQFKKCEKHPWRSVTFNTVAEWKPLSLPKVTLLYECFSRFLNSTNGTKLCKTSHQNLLWIHENWKIVGSNLFGKLKINGNLAVKSKVPPRSGSVALRQLNPILKKDL